MVVVATVVVALRAIVAAVGGGEISQAGNDSVVRFSGGDFRRRRRRVRRARLKVCALPPAPLRLRESCEQQLAITLGRQVPTSPRVGLTAGSAAAAAGAACGRGLKPCAIQIPCGTHLGARSLNQMQYQDEAEDAE
jgi:hypothetical protein